MASLRNLLAAALLAAPTIAVPGNLRRDEIIQSTVISGSVTVVEHESIVSTSKPTSIAKPRNKVQQVMQEVTSTSTETEQEPPATVIETVTSTPSMTTSTMTTSSMTAFDNFVTIVPVLQWEDPQDRNWTATVACRTDGCDARRTVRATEFNLEQSPMPTFTDTEIRTVCQNSETVYPRVTPPPEVPEGGVWMSELHFSKTDGPMYCGGYGKLNRCMARYTGSWKQTTSTSGNSTWTTTVHGATYSGHKSAQVQYVTSSASVVTSTITHAGPHWGVASPKSFYAKAEDKQKASCDSESSCLEHCRHSHKKGLKVLWILLGVFGGLILLALLGYLLKKYLSGRSSYEVEEVRTNRPRGVRDTTEARTVA